MDYADAIRRQAEDAPRAALPAVVKALWTAFAAGQVTETEAEALSVLIEARTTVTVSSGRSAAGHAPNPTGTSLAVSSGILSDRQGSPRAGAGSRPRTGASLERRRRWAASGRLPPALAAKFTLAEQAALALVAAETARKGDCRLAIEHMAAVAGVSRSTVKAAIREARKLGLLIVEERRVSAFRNDTNVVRIISPEWTAWLRLARKGLADRDTLGRGMVKRHPISAGRELSLRREQKGGGVKSSTGSPTQVSKQGKTRTAEAPQGRFAGPVRAL